jgi:hypothetical protein
MPFQIFPAAVRGVLRAELLTQIRPSGSVNVSNVAVLMAVPSTLPFIVTHIALHLMSLRLFTFILRFP